MDCEVCGDPIFGRGTKVIIDGAQLIVCGRCASQTTIVKSPPPPAQFTQPRKASPTATRPRSQPQTRRNPPAVPTVPEDVELISSYGQVIRKARQAMQLSQEDLGRKIAEKVSVLQKIESGRLVPDDSVVRKLEHALKIQLKQASSKNAPSEEKFSRPMELTLGDVAVMQKKRGEGEETSERK